MNGSYSEEESELKMQAAALRQQLRGSMMMKEKEEELALFLEMKRRDNNTSLLYNNAQDFDSHLEAKPGTSPIFNISSSRKTPVDDFLNSDNDKNDYEWLLTPPGTPLFPSLEMESQQTVMSQIGAPKARPSALKSRLANPQPDSAIRGNSKNSTSSPGLNSSGSVVRRPSSSGGPGSRPPTPTGHPTPISASRTSRSSTPTSRPSLQSPKPATSTIRLTTSVAKTTSSAAKSTSSATRPTASVTKTTVPARSSTPTRSTVRSSTPTPARSTARSSTPTPARSTARSSTPTPARSTARSSTPTPTARSSTPTPTAKTSMPPSKSTSRAATPTRRPSTPSSASSVSTPSIKSSPSVTRPASMITRSPVLSHGVSPAVKSRPWKPSEMPGYSLNAPPNLRTTLPDRPPSATRGRPGTPSSRSSSIEPLSNGRTRRQSCSPSRVSARNGFLHATGSSVPAISRHSKVNDNVSPVLMGTKMVERVINMRKLAPPKQDDKHSPHSNLSGKSASPDSSGFGRTLSKKSLDMAIRHMDIRRTIPVNLRPLMTNIPASSMYSVRSGRAQTRTISVSDSPHATSSNASSEISMNKNGSNLDAIQLEDDVGRSPVQSR